MRTLGVLNLSISVMVTEEQKKNSHSSHQTGRITQRKTFCRHTLATETDICAQHRSYPKFLEEGIMVSAYLLEHLLQIHSRRMCNT